MGNTNGTPGNSNIIATGHTMYINDKGETVTDTIHHYNGETVRSSETGILPTTGGGFISQQLYTAPWVGVVLAATVFLLVSTVLMAMMRQKLNKKTRPIPTVEERVHSIPLYSLNNPRAHLPASGAKWNIDLLAEV